MDTHTNEKPPVHIGEKPTHTDENPAHTVEKPMDIDEEHTYEKPTHTDEKKPTHTDEKPTHTGEKHTDTDENPTHTDEKPTHTDEKPTHTDEKSVSELQINDLPDSVLLDIFFYFTPQQLSTRLAFVCSRWHTLSRLQMLWKRLELKNISLDRAVQLFRTAPIRQLKCLSFQWKAVENADDFLALVSAHCPSLVDISLKTPAVTLSNDALRTLGRNCPNIENVLLCLNGRLLTLKDRCKVFENFQNLRVLELFPCMPFSYGLTLFDCSSCARLECVKVDFRYPYCLNEFPAFIESVRPALKCFRVDEDSDALLSEGDYKAIARCPKLNEISVIYPGSNFSDECLCVFGQMRCLETLELCDAALTSAGVIAAFAAEGSFRNLKTLRFCFLATDDDALIAIADSCSQLSTLMLFELEDVTDHSVCRIVTKCSNLKKVSINCSKLTGMYLWSIPKCLPHLRELNVRGENMNAAYVNELKLARPDVLVDEHFTTDFEMRLP